MEEVEKFLLLELFRVAVGAMVLPTGVLFDR